jgi:hypothetical protein
MPLDTTDLEKLPKEIWEEEPSKRWMELCHQFQRHQRKVPSMSDISFQRKWELVSAYQKCVRRGLLDKTMWLLGGFQSIFRSQPKEKSYFWKRICTTAYEDIGYGDPELMNFVLACSTVFTPSKVTDQQLLKIWSFLTKQMCRMQKSRIYCQLSIVEEMLRRGETPAGLDDWESALTLKILAPVLDTPKQRWAEKNNWRGEGMVHFQHLIFTVKASKDGMKAFETLDGLPDFTYDTHTRRGKKALVYLSRYAPFNQYFAEALGWALFFAEGGKIPNGLHEPKLDLLEAKFVAEQLGLRLQDWTQLVKDMEEAVANGLVNNLRNQVLSAMPHCERFPSRTKH